MLIHTPIHMTTLDDLIDLPWASVLLSFVILRDQHLPICNNKMILCNEWGTHLLKKKKPLHPLTVFYWALQKFSNFPLMV